MKKVAQVTIYVFINLNYLTVDYKVTEKSFNFPKKYGLPFYFVSAADGTNVVKVGPQSFVVQYLCVCSIYIFLVACITYPLRHLPGREDCR